MILRAIGLGVAMALAGFSVSQARHVSRKTERMSFAECSARIDGAAQTTGATIHNIVNTPSKRVTHSEVSNGYVEFTCLRDRGVAQVVTVTR